MASKHLTPDKITRRVEVSTAGLHGGTLAHLSDEALATKERKHDGLAYYHRGNGELRLFEHHAGVAKACRAEQAKRGGQ